MSSQDTQGKCWQTVDHMNRQKLAPGAPKKKRFKGVLHLTSSPTLGMDPGGSVVMEWKQTLQGTYGPKMNAFWLSAIYQTWETLM